MGSRYPIQRTAVSVLIGCLFAGALSQAAFGWGPRARQAIAIASLQLARQRVPDAFLAGDVSYEADLMRGAAEGISSLGDNLPINSDTQAVDAIYAKIQILREARRNGAGSYFAYEMGGLAALTAGVTLPYGLAFTESEMLLSDQIESDLEANVDRFRIVPRHLDFHYILDTRLYFSDRRGFMSADKQLIIDDYARGRAYYGYLSQAGASYFQQAVNATTDVWYTVLRPEGDPSDVHPSSRQMALHYLDEVGYLLSVRGNMAFAKRAYSLFEKYNPGMPKAYVTAGDRFYTFGTKEGKALGVEQWKLAQRIPGASRQAASKRLAKHYIEEGEEMFRRSQEPSGLETDLPDALRAFSAALEYDLTNDVAARRITETTVAIKERRDQYELQQRFLENAAGIMKVAERSTLESDFGNAITSYNQALMLVEQVTPDFRDLHESSRDVSSQVRKDIRSVISQVFSSANESIEKGDGAVLNGNIDEGIRFYSMVSSIVSVIPAEEGSINAQKKQDLIDTAQSHINDAELQRERQQARDKTAGN